jgi:hypothetical protein
MLWNKDGGLSDEPALALVFDGGGGGGKTGFDEGSGDDRYTLEGESRVAGELLAETSSDRREVLLLRGGLYGGGAVTKTSGCISDLSRRQLNAK